MRLEGHGIGQGHVKRRVDDLRLQSSGNPGRVFVIVLLLVDTHGRKVRLPLLQYFQILAGILLGLFRDLCAGRWPVSLLSVWSVGVVWESCSEVDMVARKKQIEEEVGEEY